MKIILLKNISKLGKADEIKEVATGYARNFLIPQNLAVQAIPIEIKKLEQRKKMKESQKEKEMEKNKELKEKLEKMKIEIKVKADEKGKLFGSVGQKEIANALMKQGMSIDERQIEIEKPIKEVGEYVVKVKLAEGIEGKVRIIISNF